MTQHNSTAPSRWKIAAAFAAIYIIWGSTYLGIRFAIETIPPFLMAGVRFLLAGAMLYGWARVRGAPRPLRVHWRSAAIIGALLLLGGNGGVTWGEQHIASGLAALLVATVPIWIAALDWLRPGGTRPDGPVIAGLLLGFVGILLLVGPGNLGGGEGNYTLGTLAVLGAAFSWALGSLYSKRAPLPGDALQGIGMEMLAGGVWLWLAGTLAGEWGQLNLGAISLRSGLALAYLTLFGSLVGFTAYVWLLRVVSPARAATYAYVNPVVAVFLGWALAGEELTPLTLVAAAVIIAGVVITTTYRAQPRVAAEQQSTV
ncbi:MAG TPA: drug/metabolite exporter YedA [Aggregatilineales bacterium]|nr:drug/metabolite exporter YedA [Aggregatilineales bacterium]